MDLLILSFGELSETNMVRIPGDIRELRFQRGYIFRTKKRTELTFAEIYFMYSWYIYVDHCLFDVFLFCLLVTCYLCFIQEKEI